MHLRKSEVRILNELVFSEYHLAFVDPASQKATDDGSGLPKPSDPTADSDDKNPVVLTKGCHFVIINDNAGDPQVVLNYNFEEKPKDTKDNSEDNTHAL